MEDITKLAEICMKLDGEYRESDKFYQCAIDKTEVWVSKEIKNPFTSIHKRKDFDIMFFKTTKIEYDEEDKELAVRRGIARAFVDRGGEVRVNID